MTGSEPVVPRVIDRKPGEPDGSGISRAGILGRALTAVVAKLPWLGPALVILAVAVLVAAQVVAFVGWERTSPVQAGDMVAGDGHSFTAPIRVAGLPGFRFVDDSLTYPKANYRLLEDGVPLPNRGVAHDVIRKTGAGAHSLWRDTLYFAASDNSDPRSNGRRYLFVGDVIVAPAITGWALVLLCLGLAPMAVRRVSAIGWRRRSLAVLVGAAQAAPRLGSVLAILAMAVLVAAQVVAFVGWERTSPVQAGDMVAGEGHSFTAPIRVAGLPGFRFVDDSLTYPKANYRLLEDGAPLPNRGVAHDVIRKTGAGAHSLWRNTLYFTASDNSDPRSNGRRYLFVGDVIVAPAITGWALVLLCLGLAPMAVRRVSAISWQRSETALRHAVQAPLHCPSVRRKRPLAAAVGFGVGVLVCLQLLFGMPPGWLPVPPIHVTMLVMWLGLAFVGAATALGGTGARSGPAATISASVMLSGLLVFGLLLFVTPLLTVWSTGLTNYDSLGGLLPFSDAKAYYDGGQRLLHEGTLDDWNTRRPLNAALHALRFSAVGGNLQYSLALAALAAGMASLLLASELRRSLGLPAALVFFLLAALYATPYLRSTLSEVHGFTLGVVGLAALWRAASDRNPLLFGLGMAVLALGLNARSGTFLVIPFLLLWGTVGLVPGRLVSWRGALCGVVGTIIGFSAPTLFVWLWGTDGGAMQANFSYTLYGMVAGGGGWKRIYTDHPEIFSLSGEREQGRAMYGLALRMLLENPMPFLTFYVGEISRFFHFSINLVLDRNDRLWVVSGILLTVGMATAVLRCRDLHARLLTALLAGMTVSSPFLMTDGGARVFAATAPVIIMTTALGLAMVLRAGAGAFFAVVPTARPRAGGRLVSGTAIAALVTLALTVTGPIAAVSLRAPALPAGAMCPAGQTTLVSTPGRTGAFVRVVADDQAVATAVPTIRASDFFAATALDIVDIAPAFMSLPRPFTVYAGYNEIWKESGTWFGVFAVIDGAAPQLSSMERLRFCADPNPPAGLTAWQGYVFRVRNIDLVHP